MTPTTERTLWYRTDRAGKWQPLATRPLISDLLAIVQEYPESGEFLTLPAGDTPNDQRHAAAQVPPAGRAPV